jgi:hypothetical protein
MKIIKSLAFATLAPLAVALLFQPAITRADNSAPVHITFEKCLRGDGHFVGTVDGNCGTGSVDYVDLGSDYSKSVWQMTGEYTVDNGECSFKAVVSGIVNTQTGLIVLNGVVTEGPYAGGQFHVRAQLIIGADGSVCSQGEMTMTHSN